MSALLTVLVEDFEEAHYALPRASPGAALAFLMEQQGMSPAELASLLRVAEADAAMLVSGASSLEAGQIGTLAQRFHTSPEVFF